MTILQANNIRVGYDRNQPVVIDDLTMEIVSGELVGVIGPNGCGKSTLVRALSRALRPSSGTVSLDGQDLYQDVSARTAARTIGVVPQTATLTFGFTVREIVRMGRSPHLARHPFAAETDEDERIVATAIRDAGIKDIADHSAAAISGGQWQRTLLARALAQQTHVLLLDEPTAHLDILHQVETLTQARNLAHREGRAVLAVLHDLNLAAAFSDRLIMMSEGRIVADGPPEQVLTTARIHDVYAADVWIRHDPAMNRPTVLPLPPGCRSMPPPDLDRPAKRVHVICGGGTGAALLFALSRHGYDVSAGMLTVGDMDAEAARALGVPYVHVPPFVSPPADCVAAAKNAFSAAPILILTQMPPSLGNLPVLQWVLDAAETGKLVICLQQSGDDILEHDHAGSAAGQVRDQILQHGAALVQSVDVVLDVLKAQERVGSGEK